MLPFVYFLGQLVLAAAAIFAITILLSIVVALVLAVVRDIRGENVQHVHQHEDTDAIAAQVEKRIARNAANSARAVSRRFFR